MARPIRIHVPGGFYHVTLRGNHRRDIFRTPSDRSLLNTIVAACLDKYRARAHAYCWMSNHIHLLLQVGDPPLGHLIRTVASGYARAFQRKLDTTGHLFERRYHAVLVDTDAYLLDVVRYVHLNPVRAGMVPEAGAYRWSSHQAYLGGGHAAGWVTTDFALRLLSGDRARALRAYRRFMDVDAKTVASPFAHVTAEQPGILGGPEFVARFATKSPRQRTLQALEALIAEACARFEVTRQQLVARRGDAYFIRIRAWVARQSLDRGVARLAAVARMLGCDPKTLRDAMKAFPRDEAA